MSGVIKTLASKPWLSGQDTVGAPADVEMFKLPEQKVGLRVFFAVATSLFLLFIVSYRMRMYYEDWVPLQEPMLMWFNTAVLALASVFMQMAKGSAAAEQWPAARRWLMLGGAGAIAFVTLQFVVWQQLAASGHFVSSNPSSSFFYLITGVHGAHMLGGILALARTLQLSGRPEQREHYRMNVDLCTVYWHFLLVVWLVLFYMLLTT
ncbi:MAG: cytochrome c oxidase subunit 3 [Halieaceae bacterium]